MLALAAVGCGGGDGSQSQASPPSSATAATGSEAEPDAAASTAAEADAASAGAAETATATPAPAPEEDSTTPEPSTGSEPSPDAEPSDTSSAPLPEVQDYSGRGPYSVGVTTRTLSRTALSTDGAVGETESGAAGETESGAAGDTVPGAAGDAVPDRVVYIYYPAESSSASNSEPWTYSSLDAFDEVMRPLMPEYLVSDFVFDDAFTDPPAAPGPFPLVLFSHGWGGYPTDSSDLMIRIASWGFVVAAPDHYERDRMASTPLRPVPFQIGSDVADLLAAADLVWAETAADGPLAGLSDSGSPLSAVGMSAGGGAARAMALAGRAAVWVGWAPGLETSEAAAAAVAGFGSGADSDVGADSDSGAVAGSGSGADSDAGVGADSDSGAVAGSGADSAAMGLVVASDDDMGIPLDGLREFAEAAEPPVGLVVLDNAGHNSFNDSCPEIRARGGLVQYADELGVEPRLLELGEDGCRSDNTDAREFWPLIAHLTVAQIRTQLGLDDGSSLDAEWLLGRFPGLIEAHTSG